MRSFIIFTLSALVVSSVAQLQSELCDNSNCPNGGQCFTRTPPNAGDPDFVCECASPFQMGYDCGTPSDNQFIFTRFGSPSGYDNYANTFETPDWPGNYNDRMRILYLLYLPGASEITFTFNLPFNIESNKDELYVGAGSGFSFDQLDGATNEAEQKFFFDGSTPIPDTFTIQSDVVWMYFLSDKNNNDMIYEGFQLSWEAPDVTSPVISGCPSNVATTVELGTEGAALSWTSPTATDDSGTATLIQRSHQTSSFFLVGTTPVTYVFSDPSGNTATCTFNAVVVAVDTTPPVIQQLPTITETVVLGQANIVQVTWTAPSVSDNSGVATLVSLTNQPGSFFTIGSTPVTYTYTDPSGNTASMTFTVVVTEVDITPPVITPVEDVTITVPLGSPGITVDFTEPTATDNSGTVILVSQNHFPFEFFLVGTTPVTYVFRDASGNTNSITFNINVVEVDTIAPVIPSLEDITITVPLGSSGTTVTWDEPTATDNSGIVTLIARTRSPGDFFTPGTTTVSYTFTDPSGNTATITFNVNVVEVDATPPVINQPEDITITVPLGSPGTVVTWEEPTATDNSGVVNLAARTRAPGTFFTPGTSPVSYTFVDPSGNTATVTFNVNVVEVDGTAPVIPQPEDITITVPLGSPGTTVSWDEPSATDNSGTATLTVRTRAPGDFFVTGTTPVTYQFTDPSGNTATVTFNVNVVEVDGTAPVIPQPEDITITVPLGSPGTTVSWDEPSATDNSGTATLTARTRAPGDFFVTGTTPVTYEFTDPSGNTATVTFNVNVVEVDGTAPVIPQPEDITVTVPLGSAGTVVVWPEPSATDNSGTATLTDRTRAPGTFFTPGTTPVSYTFTDPSGNTATVTFNVNVVEVDGTAPVISQPEDITVTVPLGSAGTVVVWPEPSATDNSGTATLTDRTRAPGTFFTPGTTPVSYTFTDPSGNTATVTFNVNVVEVDETAPVIPQPEDITITVPLGSPGTVVTWEEPTATDNSGVVNLAARTRAPGTFFTPGTSPVTYTFVDPSGNTASVTFNVNVVEVDGTAPVIPQPEDITITVPLGSPGTVVTWEEPTATDNSGVVNLSARTRAPGTFFTPGTSPVTYTFVDPSGNTASVTFNVNVVEVDGTAPVIPQPEDITITVPLGSPGTTVSWDEPSATDNSGTATLTDRTRAPGTFFTPGTTPVTYTFVDPSGNTATVTFNVNVIEVDTIAPVIPQVEDITITVPLGSPGATVSWDEPIATDNSGVQTLTDRTRAPGDFFTPGTTPVTYEFTDPSGNTATMTFNVNVIEVDDIAPVIPQVEDITITVPLGSPGTVVTWPEPSATDNSGTATLTDRTRAPGTFFTPGTTPVTYTFTDPSGNTATMTFNVNVIEVDGTAPVISGCSDVSAEVGLNIGGTVVTWTEPTATDNSGEPVILQSRSRATGQFFVVGTTEITYVFADTTGNTARCTFIVTVVEVDKEPPFIFGCRDISIEIGLNTGGSSVTWIEPSAWDNSGFANLLSRSHAPGQFFKVGNTPVTYTFVDGSGNSALCVFSVSVIEVDDVIPVINGCVDVTTEIGLNIGGSVVTWTEPIATDNSGVVTLQSRTRAPGQFFVVGPTAVTYVFVDGTGNTATCTFTVTVVEVDDVAPVISGCDDVAIEIGLNIGGSAIVWIEPIATDNSGVVILQSRSHAPGQFFVVGTTPVTYVFVDGTGNTATCTFTVAVVEVDRINPVITGCADISTQIGLNVGGTIVTWTEPSATDNSGVITLQSRTRAPGQFFVVGPTEVTYVFVDGSGNTATCTFTVTVVEVDDVIPVITGCADVSAQIGLNVGGVVVTWTEPTASDNSGVVTLQSRTRAPGQFFVVGTTDVTYVFVDGTGNTATCTFTVTVVEVDDVIPVITGCADVSSQIGLNVGGVVVTWTEPTASDNSGVVTLQSRTRAPGQFFVVGTTDVTYVFVDGTGNTATCTFTVTVLEVDEVIPVITGCADVSAQIGLNVGGVVVTWTEPTASDNSGVVTLQSRTRAPGQFFVVGTTDITYVFVDGTGNTATCTFTVTVLEVDDVIPVITGCADVSAQIGLNVGGVVVTWTEPTATDNSGVVTLQSRTRAPGQFFVVGTTDVTYVFVDGTGNTATCTFTVTVVEVDDVIPVITGCADVFGQIGLNVGGVVVTWTEPTASDNSGIVTLQSRTRAPGQFFLVGTTDVTYVFVDGTGNTATCTFTVTVVEVDDIVPVISDCEDITATVGLNIGGTVVTYAEPTATDNSGVVFLASRTHTPGQFYVVGPTIVTYRFVDGTGNSETCTFTVTVVEVDDVRPVIFGCDDVTATVGQSSNAGGVIVTWNEPTATDNSGSVSLASRTRAPGQFFVIGPTIVSYRFIDPTGNSEECSFTVTVAEFDDILPVISGCDDFGATVGLNIGGTIVQFTEPTATDNSGEVSLQSRSRAPGQFFLVGSTEVTYVFVDSNGNTASCVFNVIVAEVDEIAPVVSFCQDFLAEVLINVGGLIVEFPEPIASDNSGTVTVAQSSRQPGEFFIVGSNPVVYTFVDPSGNTAVCNFNVVVSEYDDVAPEVVCVDDVTQTIPLNTGGVIVTWSEPTATDNSGSVSLATRSHAPGQFFETGVTQVIYSFVDPSDNSVVCTFSVIVNEVDFSSPVVEGCPIAFSQNTPLGSPGRIVTWEEPVATDNSGTVFLSSRSFAPGMFFQVGETTVAYVFSDPTGNEATCVFVITVVEVDEVPPVVACITDVTETTPLGTTGAIVQWTEPTATDNSGVVSLASRTHAPASFFLVGNTEVTYQFIDSSGNTADCVFAVIVVEVDGTAPVISGCDDQTATVALNIGAVQVDYIEPTATDNSGVVNLASRTRIPGSFFLVGATEVTYVFVDGSGNTETCVFSITVIEVDEVKPMVICVDDISTTIQLFAGGSEMTWIEPTASDNSGTVTILSQSAAPGDYFFTGNTPVTYIFADPSGNSESCTFNVEVIEVDGTVPVIENCPEDRTQIIPLNAGGIIMTWVEPTATDNSGTVTLASRTHSPGTYFETGFTQVIYRFSDPSDNSATCTFSIFVNEVDGTPPMVNCINSITEPTPLGTSGTTVTWEEPTATDNSGTVTLASRTHAPGQFFVVGSVEVTYRYVDGTGNEESCVFTVTVIEVDEVPPVISGCDDQTATVALNIGAVQVDYIEPTATDNSDVVNLASRTRIPGSFFLVGSTEVTYVFVDGSGNTETCTFTIAVIEVDEVKPIVVCVDDISTTVALFAGGSTMTWVEPTAMDNSGSVSIASQSATPGDFFITGTTPVTYVFVDPSGNSESCTFNVEVVEVDGTPPDIVQCVEDITRVIPLNAGGVIVTWTEPIVTDNSGTVTLASQTHTTGTFFNTGFTQVLYRYVDPTGNSAICTFSVLVNEVDGTNPVIENCPVDFTETTPLGSPGRTVTWTAPTATDNSGVVSLSMRSHVPGQFFLVGLTTVTYEFTDPTGNQATCGFTILIVEVDEVPPVIACLTAVQDNVELGTVQGTIMTWEDPTATDNSGVVNLSSRTHAPGQFFLLGETQVTYVFTDESGNSADCTFAVIVGEVDTTAPVIACVADVEDTVELGEPGKVITWVEPTATDLSGSATLAARSQLPESFFAITTTPITYTFVDPSGNTASCTFNVILEAVDTTAPEPQCVDGLEAIVELGTPGATVTWVTPTAIDISGQATIVSNNYNSGDNFIVGVSTVVYVFTDPSGNTASCTWPVTVTAVDTQSPSLECPNAISETVPLGNGGSVITWILPTTTDNSGVVNVVSTSHNSGDFFGPGTTIVLYRVSDPSGNTAECTWLVTVTEVDEVPPLVIGCPLNIIDTVPLGVPGKVIVWNEPSSNDNSGISSMTSRTHAPGQFFTVDTTTVTYEFSDGSGNTASCSFTVFITEVDSTSPVVTCPADISLTIRTGLGGSAIEFAEPTAIDNSGTATRISATHESGSFFILGETTVTYQFADPSNNVGSCSFLVIISDADPCSNLPCLNGGVCVVESLTEYSCVCPECFSGQTCEIEQNACDTNQCANGAACAQVEGSCTAYTCECPACFFGEYCQETVNPCENNQCANGAQCLPDPDDCTLYYCLCPTCYEGQFCELAIDACANNLCQNGAQCIPTLNGGCTEYTCSCTGCFTGQYCEDGRNVCDLNPCGNGGICTEVQGSCSAYTCECQGCFTGYNCEQAIQSPCLNDPCENGGQCNVVVGQCFAYSCTCPEGYAGVNCQTIVTRNINPCSSFPCINGGSCLTMDSTDYICMCPEGYAGVNCQTIIASSGPFYNACLPTTGQEPKCGNNATCVNSYNSLSLIGGSFANPQYSCVCTFGYTGVNCQFTTSDNEELDICNLLGRPRCENGGICHNAYHQYDGDVDYVCDCPVGFIGHNCETNYYDPCVSAPCQNAGACSSFNTYYTCQCPDGFLGVNCEIEINPDNIPPVVANVPNSVFVYTDTNGAFVTWDSPTATDESGDAFLIRNTHASGSYFALGTTPVSYVFRDSANNAVSVVFFVTVLQSEFVVDNTPPEISNCPDSVTVEVPLDSFSGGNAAWDIPTATDNSGATPSRSSNFNPGDLFPLGLTLVVYTFTDGSGNVATCSFEISIQQVINVDVTPPTISGCPTEVRAQAGQGENSAVASWTVPTATDDSEETPSVSSSHNPGQSFLVGTTQVNYIFSDQAGNIAICTFSVVVSSAGVIIDVTPPTITGCPTDVEAVLPQDSPFVTVTWTSPTATDDSNIAPQVTSNYASGDAFAAGSNEVTYTFTDDFGNSASCSFFVNVATASDGSSGLTVSGCPEDIALSSTSSFTQVTWTPPTAVDSNGGEVTVVTNYPNPTIFVATDQQPIRVTYTFSDSNGNTAVCEFSISVTSGSVVDTVPPTIVGCPSDLEVTAASGATSAVVTWTSPTATDNSGVAPSVFATHVSGAVFDLGSTPVSYTFVDAAGNSAICSFSVIVNAGAVIDTTPPTITGCPAGVIVTVPAGVTSAVATWASPTAIDDSGVAPTVTATHVSGAEFDLGTTGVFYTFTDAAGNSAICLFEVTVSVAQIVDTTPPTLIGCPASAVTAVAPMGQMSTTVEWPEITAGDTQDSNPTLEQSASSGDSFNVGSTSVTYTATDAAGNQASCSFTVIVTAANPSNPCESSPCLANQACYYTQDEFICLTIGGRKRRDIDAKWTPYQ